MPPITEYCDTADLTRWGINATALKGISEKDAQLEAIKGASRLIDSYLRSQFTLPLSAVGEDLQRACAIIAVYDLISSRGFRPDESENDVLRQRYEDVIRWLEKISAGQVTPVVTDSSATPGTTGAPKVTSNAQRGWFDTDSSRAGPFGGSR